ncbi:hypothetical protein [Bergeyella sp. RCAD1439]|uniref:hypothetical protein n=1 Tax=Bergeyella anatis TaxID=3113737 RepID=UPI002E1862E6|nr:hypothetical protein [Bergeyella sp. RCAD1439]
MIEELTLAGFTFKDVVISASQDESGVSSFDGYLGILGADFINRFNILLDYQRKILYLKPNESYPKAFEIPLTGFKLKEENGRLTVGKIAKENPFYTKGLRSGDVIRCINGKTDKKQIETLLKQEGKTICIRFIQQNQKKTLKHRLTPLLKP